DDNDQPNNVDDPVHFSASPLRLTKRSNLAFVGVLGGLLCVAGAALQLPFNLLGTAVDLLTGATRHFAYLALHLSCDVLGCTLDLVLVHENLRLRGPIARGDI